MGKLYEDRRLSPLVIAIGLALGLGSCKKNPEAEATFFLKATPVLVDTVAGQGSGSHKILDIWLYVNGKFQGAYPSGKLMPIINKNGKVQIVAQAGISNNGIASTRIPYPFYSKLEFDTLVAAGQQISKPFHFKYNTDFQFKWIEDFENNVGVSLVASSVSDTSYNLCPASESFEGRSIVLELSSSQVVGQLESASSYELPTTTANVFLELNYKCNTTIQVGLMDNTTAVDFGFSLSPKSEWNKVYLRLADVIKLHQSGNPFKLCFKIIKTDGDGVDHPKAYFDNIKLLVP